MQKMVDQRLPDGSKINDPRMLDLQRSSEDNDEIVNEDLGEDERLSIRDSLD